MVALGFAVVWHAAKAVNFSFGTLFMLGGVLTVVFTWWGLPLLAAGLAAIASTVVVAALIERAFVRPFDREANAIGWILTTIAAGVMIESATTATCGLLGHLSPDRCSPIWRSA